MKKMTMLFSGISAVLMVCRTAAVVKKMPVLVFLLIFMFDTLCLDAGEGSVAAYECCVSAEAEDTWISEEYQGYCREIGREYNICPELLMAMVERESNGMAWASNSAGDSGLLQVNPRWHHGRMERLGVTDLYDPYSNILVAADYLAELFRQEEDLYLVLMKYNMSPDAAERLYRQGDYSEYATRIAERAWELETLHGKE